MKTARHMHFMVLTVVAAAILSVGASAAQAQAQPGPLPPSPTHKTSQAPPPSQQKVPEPKISVEAALVNMDVLVTDEDGVVLPGLKQENFRVLDNGQRQIVTHFEPTGAPITIAMLMEYSGLAYDYFAYK